MVRINKQREAADALTAGGLLATIDYQQVIVYLIIACALLMVIRGIYRAIRGRGHCCNGTRCKKKNCR
ncbi:MAG: hypothetical protein LBP56_06240 [Odoribacteraceae bacterium]|nr:hypothetical protein [Odoribacteraceae bacterium]